MLLKEAEIMTVLDNRSLFWRLLVYDKLKTVSINACIYSYYCGITGTVSNIRGKVACTLCFATKLTRALRSLNRAISI